MTTTVDERRSSADRSRLPSDEPFVDAVRRGVRPLDVAILLLPAVMLLGVGLLPWELRKQLAFSYTEPTLLTAFTAHFVHADSIHLFRNVAGYLLVVPTVYVLSILADRRQLFYIVFVVVLVALLAVVGYGVSLRRLGIDRSTLRGPPAGYVEFGAWSVAILLIGLITAFPAGPLSDAGLVNIYTHFLGYTLGFLSSYLAVLLFLKPE